MSEKEIPMPAEPEKKPEVFTKGVLKLKVPLRAKSEDVKELPFDFTALTGWEYCEAMDSDNQSNVFTFTNKQAFSLFAAAAGKASRSLGLDARDIKERLSVEDTMAAVEKAMLFFLKTRREVHQNFGG